jgi:hypothetical protein
MKITKEKIGQELPDEKYREMLELLQKAQETTGQQLSIDINDGSLKQINEIRELIDKNIDDPTEKYELYYNGIQKVIKKYLPKGKSFKKYRDIIYDEKNIFLTRGKAKDKNGIRHGDGRMTYNDDMKEMVDLVANWVMSSQDPIDLYKSLYEINEKYNYGHQRYDDTSLAFNKDMKKTL